MINFKNVEKIGIALSGGGYRAAAYHIGTLRALNRLGILDKVDVISSVLGGSIISAYYAFIKITMIISSRYLLGKYRSKHSANPVFQNP